MSRIGLISAAALLVAACGKPSDPTATASTEPSATPAISPSITPEASPNAALAAQTSLGAAAADPLPARLDCLRKSGGVLLIGHRGGPTRDFPENAVETFERTYKAGTHGMEIDIAETKDGVLILMHDDNLDKSTTGHGPVADATWPEIQKLKLRTYSKTTDYGVPTLDAALAFAVRTGAILELDKKPTATWDKIVAAVRKAKAQNNVFLVTYNESQALEAARLAPDLIVSASIARPGDLDALVTKGLKPEHLVAWTGNETPDPELWKAIAAKGVEPEFGTIGGGRNSLDTRYWSDGDGAEYSSMVEGGRLSILVTGITDKVSRQLAAELAKGRACGF